jgi:hypothetical protein
LCPQLLRVRPSSSPNQPQGFYQFNVQEGWCTLGAPKGPKGHDELPHSISCFAYNCAYSHALPFV